VNLHAAAVGEREVFTHAEDLADYEMAGAQVGFFVMSSGRPACTIRNSMRIIMRHWDVLPRTHEQFG
jgi:hypothetical protein